VDVWLAEMEDYLHAAKFGQHSAVELAQSYLKGYASTWWRTVRQEEGKTHGYTWEFFKERIESEFIPKNSNYISRCKLYDLMNAKNDNFSMSTSTYDILFIRTWVPTQPINILINPTNLVNNIEIVFL